MLIALQIYAEGTPLLFKWYGGKLFPDELKNKWEQSMKEKNFECRFFQIKSI